MRNDKAIIIFNVPQKDISVDLEIPLNITANELILALNKSYDLGIDIWDKKSCYLKSEYPIALLKGNKTLDQFGIQNGSIINVGE